MIFGDHFIGRIEAVPDRKKGVLEVRGLWLESGVRKTLKLSRSLERTLANFAKFNGCTAVDTSFLEQGCRVST